MVVAPHGVPVHFQYIVMKIFQNPYKFTQLIFSQQTFR